MKNPTKRIRKPCGKCNTKFIRLSRYEMICPRCYKRARDNGFNYIRANRKSIKTLKKLKTIKSMIKLLSPNQRKGLITSRVEKA